MKKFLPLLLIPFGILNISFAEEVLSPDAIKVSKKIISINQEAIREPASTNDSNKVDTQDAETLSNAMEELEEPKLWFNP